MPSGRIDRNAWAQAVQELMVRFDPGPKGAGNKSAFARRIGYTTRTIERWIAQQNDVTIESVRSVIEALHLDRRESGELLTRIGFHLSGPPVLADPSEDPVVRMILADPQWDEDTRTYLVKRELDRIEREQAQRIADYHWFIQQQSGRERA